MSDKRPTKPLGRARVKRGWTHLVLLLGVVIFTFPFVWMIATSMKTDEELTDPTWLPRIPRFVSRSPYVLPDVIVLKPLGVTESAWRVALPRIAALTRDAVRQTDPNAATDHVNAAATVVMDKLITQIPLDKWTAAKFPDDVLEAYRSRITPELINAALSDRLARLELRGMLIRALDGRISELCNAKDVARRWLVESGDARIETAADGASYLRYAFNTSDDPPIVLRFDFDSPIAAAELHKLIVSYVADDSWHRVDATLDMPGTRWKSTRSTSLAQHRAGSLLIQPPTFEDGTFKPRKWVPMKFLPDRAGAAQPARSTLRLIIRPSSTLRAVIGKIAFNYDRTLREVPFGNYVINSLILVILCTLGTAFSSTFVAYAFARLHWPGRTVAFGLLLATMMLPEQVTMIPSFMIWRGLGWYNTLNPLWVPAWLGVAFFIFLMTQFMRTIPRELEEAARIDGLNTVQIWYYVMLPLVKPAAAAIAIMTAIGAWNDFLGPLVYLRDQSRFPLSLGLFGIRADMTSGGMDWTMLMSGDILMTLPVIVIFFVFQRYFIQGMTMSGLKG